MRCQCNSCKSIAWFCFIYGTLIDSESELRMYIYRQDCSKFEKFGKLGFYVCNSPWWTLELLTELTNTGHLPKVMTWSKSEIVITIFLLFWKMGWPVATPTQYPSFEHLSLSQRRPHSLIGKLKTSHFKGIKNYNDPWVGSYIENVWHTHITEDSK